MKRFLAILLLALPALGADDTCSSLRAPNSPGAEPKRCVSVSTFTNIATGTTVERSVSLGAETAKLHSILVSSTNCADLDITIADTSCTVVAGSCTDNNTGTTLIYFNDALLARTLDGVAYTQFVYEAGEDEADIGVTPTLDSTSNEYRVYVRLKNNDPSSDDDAVVTLIWEN